MTENDQHKRTERARNGRWAIGKIGPDRYQVINLNNGGHVYTVTHADGEWICDCEDYAQRQGRCKHIETVRLSLEGGSLDVQPLIQEDESGIHATFVDGARISLTVGGRTACSRCGLLKCQHFEVALPYYTRWLNEQAASGRWPAHRLAQLGIPVTLDHDSVHQSHSLEVTTMSQEQGPNWDEIKRQLAAPFHSYYVGWKAQATSKDKTRALAVAYIDARTVMDRLDQVVGPGNWSDTYRLISAGDGEFAIECTLALFGVPKSDVGIAEEEDDGSQASLSKSAYSDALKRAAVKWGIGRYLYRIPKQWVGYDAARKQLAETPELPAWALSDTDRGNGHGKKAIRQAETTRNDGQASASDGEAADNKAVSSELEQARATALPFGTREHPEWKGKPLGELAALNAELIPWLAESFNPTSEGGRTVQQAAQVLSRHLAKAA